MHAAGPRCGAAQRAGRGGGGGRCELPDAALRDAGAALGVPVCSPVTSDPVCLLDSDGDQVRNASDVAPANPCLPDGRVLACPGGDRDGDGLPNDFECPGLASCPDTDRDGVANYADPDSDGDGLTDGVECGDASACADSDGDGVADLLQAKHGGDSDGCSLPASGDSASAIGWLLATLIITSLLARRARPRVPRSKRRGADHKRS